MRKEINLPKEVRLRLFFVFFLHLKYLLKTTVTGGSAEQPLQDLDERAPNQPTPHLLSRIG